VLEVDNIMRFYLLLLLGVLESAMQDELPKAFALVFVNDVNAAVDWLFNRRTVLRVFVARVRLVESGHLIGAVEYNGDGGVGEVHVAVRFAVMDAQTVIVVDLVSDLFV
jgi:hypothetical protein